MDTEIRSMRSQLDLIQRHLQPSSAVAERSIAQPREVQEPNVQELEEEDDDTTSVDTTHMRELINNMSTKIMEKNTDVLEEETDHDEEEHHGAHEETVQVHDESQPTDDVKFHTVVELKEMCKKAGVSTKGTKEQLLARLNM